MKNDSRLVYSTDSGRIKEARTESNNSGSKDGIVRLERQTKGRKGKGVTLVTGVAGTDAELKKLAKKLKQQCGVGGALKHGVIDIQTDDRNKLKQLLEAEGLKVKIAGG